MNPFQNRRKEFEKLTWPLGPDLFRMAYWRLANSQDAEDAVQDAYLRAYRSFNTFQTGTNVKAWMTRILINVINDTLKKRGRHLDFRANEDEFDELAVVADDSALARNPEAQLIDKEINPDLLTALQRLPTGLLHPLLLRELEDMTYGEIAAILGIPTGTVMSRLFRARRMVRDQLAKSINRVKENLKKEGDAHELQ
jgi:RNA polymerase sigma-70 factor, ECF subfamily